MAMLLFATFSRLKVTSTARIMLAMGSRMDPTALAE